MYASYLLRLRGDAAAARRSAEAIGEDVPFVVQDYPLNFSVVMTPGVIRRVIEENPSCVMLKHEDWPGLEKISALRAWEAEGGAHDLETLLEGAARMPGPSTSA